MFDYDRTLYEPWQFTPLPANPSLQVQVKLFSVFSQVASSLQSSLFSSHSSTSVNVFVSEYLKNMPAPYILAICQETINSQHIKLSLNLIVCSEDP